MYYPLHKKKHEKVKFKLIFQLLILNIDISFDVIKISCMMLHIFFNI